jgi:hypothetical protein
LLSSVSLAVPVRGPVARGEEKLCPRQRAAALLQHQTGRQVVSIDRPGVTGSHNNTPHGTRFSA